MAGASITTAADQQPAGASKKLPVFCRIQLRRLEPTEGRGIVRHRSGLQLQIVCAHQGIGRELQQSALKIGFGGHDGWGELKPGWAAFRFKGHKAGQISALGQPWGWCGLYRSPGEGRGFAADASAEINA